MSKTRIATWIVGSLIMTSGAAFANDAIDAVPDPHLAAELAENVVAIVTGESSQSEAELEEIDSDLDGPDTSEDIDVEEPGAKPENHGSVVSQAAQNHDFDEACGNHGAYVSEVAKGGDPLNPTCDDSVEDADAATGTGSESGGEDGLEQPEGDELETADGAVQDDQKERKAQEKKANGGDNAKERPSKPSRGKAGGK